MPVLVINKDPYQNKDLESVCLWHLGLGQPSDLETRIPEITLVIHLPSYADVGGW